MASTNTSPAQTGAGAIAEVRGQSVCLVVRDLEASIAWYGRMFGFAETRRLTMTDLGMRIAFVERGAMMMELVETEEFQPQVRPDPPHYLSLQGVSQMSFHVIDADAALSRAEAAGATIVWPVARNTDLAVKACLIRDPDGNLIELLQRL